MDALQFQWNLYNQNVSFQWKALAAIELHTREAINYHIDRAVGRLL